MFTKIYDTNKMFIKIYDKNKMFINKMLIKYDKPL